MEAIHPTKTLYKTTRCHNWEGHNLNQSNNSLLAWLTIQALASVTQMLISISSLAMLDGLQATGRNICKYLPSTKDVTVHNVHNTFICQHENIFGALYNGHMVNIHISSAITALFQFLKEKNIQINTSYQITYMAYKKIYYFILCIICIVASVQSLFSQFDYNPYILVAITFSCSCHTVIFYLPKTITLEKMKIFPVATNIYHIRTYR